MFLIDLLLFTIYVPSILDLGVCLATTISRYLGIMATENADGGSEPVSIQTKHGNQHLDKNCDIRSLEERHERQLLEDPNGVTQGAQPGIQKAEATALVWTRTALYATYAWSVSLALSPKDRLISNIVCTGFGYASLFYPCNRPSARI